MYSKYRLLIEERANPSGTGYLGLAELELFSAPKSFKGMFGKAIDLNGEYFDLPFRADQDPSSSGLTFSAWVYRDRFRTGRITNGCFSQLMTVVGIGPLPCVSEV